MSTSPFAPIQPGSSFNLSAVNSPAFSLTKPGEGKKSGESFSNLFMGFIQNANDTQNKAGDYTKSLVTGQLTNTHEMMIAGAKSEVMLHLVTQIASKLSSATTTLFQMQI